MSATKSETRGHIATRELAARCRANPTPLSEWEARFVSEVEERGRALTERQAAALTNIASRVSISDIAALLADRIEELATQLKGAAPTSRHRHDVRYGNRGSFSVCVSGPKRGLFTDHEEGSGGDALTMVARLLRCDTRHAVEWAADWLGKRGFQAAPVTSLKEATKEVPSPTLPLAQRLWTEAASATRAPLERYLAGRGLTLPADAPLRFHPQCPRGNERLPAMLSLMTDPESGAAAGVHRTFLLPDASGKAAGAAKMMLGGAGLIRLVPDADVTTGLGIAEGIETALSIMQHTGWRPVWACGSAGAIRTLPVLRGIECVTIFADADDGGVGVGAARDCATRWAEAGAEAIIRIPPAGCDWHDVARRERAA